MKYDVYDGDENVRFALGRSGAAPLFIIGVNPSSANARDPDRTIEKVERLIAGWEQFDGFVMLNLYPKRASKPKELPPFDDRLTELNAQKVQIQLRRFKQATVWAAWGDAFDKLDHFKNCLSKIFSQLNGLDLNWKKCESLTISQNPRHPLGGRPHAMTELSQLTNFDIEEYLCRKECKKSK